MSPLSVWNPRPFASNRKDLIPLASRMRGSACALALTGSAIQAFGLANIHAFADVTEGGVLGMTLLLEHWLHWSPALSSLLLNGLCYWLGWRALGKDFLLYSLLAGGGFSVFYALFEPFAPLLPWLMATPLRAAIFGAIFVGVGAGLAVRAGGAPGGDDALAMAIARRTGWPIQWAYLLTDLVVLALSLSYIPARRMIYSLLTVVLSGQIIGLVERFGRKPSPSA